MWVRLRYSCDFIFRTIFPRFDDIAVLIAVFCNVNHRFLQLQFQKSPTKRFPYAFIFSAFALTNCMGVIPYSFTDALI